MERVLIVEDDEDIAELERDYLATLGGYETTIAYDGKRGLELALNEKFDCIILDIMLPSMDGVEICKRIRDKTNAPIIMVTAKTGDIDKVRGYGTGADDYVEKPFSPSVLVARVKAHIENYKRLLSCGEKPNESITVGDITLDLPTRRVYKNGEEVLLKNKEFELLAFFMKNKGVVFDRERLYERVWGMDAVGDNTTVAVHVNRLREKLENNPENPEHILTVRGAGYRFE